MIYLICDQITPRLAYAGLILGEYLWGTSIELVPLADLPAERGGIWLNYTATQVEDSFRLYPSGWLAQSQVPASFAPVELAPMPRIFPAPAMGGYDLDYDVLAAIVWLTTEAEYSVEDHLDTFGRYDQTQYPSHRLGLDKRPLLAVYAAALSATLRERYGYFPSSPFQATTKLTIDIDFPWKYAHKPWYVSVGSALKALGREPLGEVYQKMVPPRQDPFDTFEAIASLCPPACTTFFALIERRSPYDSWFTARLAPYRQLLLGLYQQGFSMGVHPSFRTSEQKMWLGEEVQAMTGILGEAVRHSRQHFLRYRTPDTYRWLIEAGIKRDYSLYRQGTGGFPAGMVRAFPWFDLEQNELTDLMLQPTMLMDRTLLSHLQLKPEEAVSYARELWEVCNAFEGTFTFLFHNDSLSEVGEWTGWKSALQTIIEMIRPS